ncbi:hypothetical protein [Roseibium sp. Sym1]|uniref:hypothetical protein n=1 Tax=Roseibium sp. Sym1 TaxID=3016006 RepID=UPI0022B30791|nr:hypothetical protein [Roseibium sp. Sym1]
MIPLSLPEPSNSKPRHFTWLWLAICILSAVLFAEKALSLSAAWRETSAARAREPVAVSVGPVRIRLPENLIASQQQRRLSRSGNARFGSLRLALHWPDLSAMEEYASVPEGSAILVDLESNPGRESLRARLEPFYRRLARGGEQPGPDGLKILTLSARAAPATDLIAHDPSIQGGFITRCRKETPAGTAVCHRAIGITPGLELRYRFDQTLLPDWRRLDAALYARARTFLVNQ